MSLAARGTHTTHRFASAGAARRAGSALIGSAVLAIILSGCSSTSSGALAHTACLDIQHSLHAYAAAAKATTAHARSVDNAKAIDDLRAAVQPAALAASNDGDWQALEATLSESSRVSESELVPALTAQCAQSLG